MNLYWSDIDNNRYLLGKFYRKDGYYYFETNEDGLKNALRKGCFGIGRINISQKINMSVELFDFFKRRIPSKENPNIKEVLESIGLEEYDEYEILRRTGARLITDKYYLE